MKYFLPDSQDLVDPSFDFETERRAATRMRHRDDQYAHEVFSQRMLDGILISKGIVDGFGGTGSRSPIALMGDCGAFTYVREPEPPYSIEDVATFYVDCGVDYGISVDHVILDYN